MSDVWMPIDAPEDETTIIVRGKVYHQEGSNPWGRMLALNGADDIRILDEREYFLADCLLPDDIRLCRRVSDAVDWRARAEAAEAKLAAVPLRSIRIAMNGIVNPWDADGKHRAIVADWLAAYRPQEAQSE